MQTIAPPTAWRIKVYSWQSQLSSQNATLGREKRPSY